MELSFLLARVIGLALICASTALFLNRKSITLLFNIYQHPEAVFITGFLETVLGIVLVQIHNVWDFNFQGVITFIGWMLLLRGLGRLFFPSRSTAWVEKIKKMQKLFTPLLIFIFLVGAYLTYMGFAG